LATYLDDEFEDCPKSGVDMESAYRRFCSMANDVSYRAGIFGNAEFRYTRLNQGGYGE
jgi:hypothetical protein